MGFILDVLKWRVMLTVTTIPVDCLQQKTKKYFKLKNNRFFLYTRTI